jgi:small subunit ribosomal protein S4
MSRYIGPVCRLCKAESVKLFLKGDRCYTEKCGITRAESGDGKAKKTSRPKTKVSEYGIRLREKQKLRRFYGIQESQFRRFYGIAEKMQGQTGHNFLQLLERRLDNVVHRLGLGASRAQARQLVLHGHFQVNGEKVDIPSYLVKAGDVVTVKEKSRTIPVIKENAEAAAAKKGGGTPTWLEFDAAKFEGKVISVPTRDQIDTLVTEQLVVEFYAR